MHAKFHQVVEMMRCRFGFQKKLTFTESCWIFTYATERYDMEKNVVILVPEHVKACHYSMYDGRNTAEFCPKQRSSRREFIHLFVPMVLQRKGIGFPLDNLGGYDDLYDYPIVQSLFTRLYKTYWSMYEETTFVWLFKRVYTSGTSPKKIDTRHIKEQSEKCKDILDRVLEQTEFALTREWVRQLQIRTMIKTGLAPVLPFMFYDDLYWCEEWAVQIGSIYLDILTMHAVCTQRANIIGSPEKFLKYLRYKQSDMIEKIPEPQLLETLRQCSRHMSLDRLVQVIPLEWFTEPEDTPRAKFARSLILASPSNKRRRLE